MAVYEMTTLDVRPGSIAAAVDEVEAALRGARDTLHAFWTAEIGVVNQVMVIQSFADAASQGASHALRHALRDLQGAGDLVTAMSIDTFAPFPYLPPMPSGALGPFYEVRSYRLKPDGAGPMADKWRAALPERVKMSPLAIAMVTADAASPRFVHIWPYRSLDERQRVRGEAVSRGVWPPKGSIDHIAHMATSIWVPAKSSPLH